jgi:hypothetical protein
VPVTRASRHVSTHSLTSFITSSWSPFFPNISRVSYLFSSEMSFYLMVLHFIPLSYRLHLHHSSCRDHAITNSRHTTEGDGLEPIRDIATVGRAWYLFLDERVALNLPVHRRCGGIATTCVWAVFRLFALWSITRTHRM